MLVHLYQSLNCNPTPGCILNRIISLTGVVAYLIVSKKQKSTDKYCRLTNRYVTIFQRKNVKYVFYVNRIILRNIIGLPCL
jgi:hypothetical protein